MMDLLEELKKQYDIIVLDTAPLQAVTDAQILSTKVDGTILVIRANKTKKDSVLLAKELLNKVGANILGIVFNATEAERGKGSFGRGRRLRYKRYGCAAVPLNKIINENGVYKNCFMY